jgi:hypothetical protein
MRGVLMRDNRGLGLSTHKNIDAFDWRWGARQQLLQNRKGRVGGE